MSGSRNTAAGAKPADSAGSDQTSKPVSLVDRMPVMRNFYWVHPKTGLKRPVMWWLKQEIIPPELMIGLDYVCQAWGEKSGASLQFQNTQESEPKTGA